MALSTIYPAFRLKLASTSGVIKCCTVTHQRLMPARERLTTFVPPGLHITDGKYIQVTKQRGAAIVAKFMTVTGAGRGKSEWPLPRLWTCRHGTEALHQHGCILAWTWTRMSLGPSRLSLCGSAKRASKNGLNSFRINLQSKQNIRLINKSWPSHSIQRQHIQNYLTVSNARVFILTGNNWCAVTKNSSAGMAWNARTAHNGLP